MDSLVGKPRQNPKVGFPFESVSFFRGLEVMIGGEVMILHKIVQILVAKKKKVVVSESAGQTYVKPMAKTKYAWLF